MNLIRGNEWGEMTKTIRFNLAASMPIENIPFERVESYKSSFSYCAESNKTEGPL